MTLKWTWMGTLAAGAVLWSTAATAQPEKTLDKCQRITGNEVRKYSAGLYKTTAKCLNKISGERIKGAAGSSAGAASACAAALRKVVNTEDPTKTLAAKAKAKIERACDPAANPDLEHTAADVLGPGAMVAGDAIEAAETGIPCLGLGGDGFTGTMQEWIDCQTEAGKRGALRQVHLGYPLGDFWLRNVRPDIVALGPAQKYLDATTALDSVRRWVDNGDGTASDYVTGLMWERKTDDGSIHDKDNTYTWSSTLVDPDGTLFTTFLSTLNGGATGVGNCTSSNSVTQSGGFAGHCDWRLPTVAEVQTILLENICMGAPCFDEAIFGATVSAGVEWTATTVATNPNSAWSYNFNNLGKTLTFIGARAVRGGS